MTPAGGGGPFTAVGTTNAGPLAAVDGRGGVQGLDGSWSLDWWVGADDRWHLPAEETAVRQRLVEATPVVETAMRIPTGDAVATTFGVRAAGVTDDLVALDVANDSTLPVALALVMTGRSKVTVEGRQAVIDGTTTVQFGRAPSRWAAGDDPAAVRAAVVDGAAAAADLTGPIGHGRVLAVLFPLAHTARLRTTLTVPAGRNRSPGTGAPGPDPAAVAPTPEAERVASGWRAQLDRGMTVRLPDEPLTDAIDLARAAILLAAAGPLDDAPVADLARLARALDGQGFGDEAGAVVAHLAGRQRLTGRFGRGSVAAADTAAALRAFGDHWRCTHDQALAEALVGPVAKAAHRIGKSRGSPGDAGADADRFELAVALHAAVDLLDGAGQPDTARLVAALPAASLDTADAGAARAGTGPVPLDQVLGGALTPEHRSVGDRSGAGTNSLAAGGGPGAEVAGAGRVDGDRSGVGSGSVAAGGGPGAEVAGAGRVDGDRSGVGSGSVAAGGGPGAEVAGAGPPDAGRGAGGPAGGRGTSDAGRGTGGPTRGSGRPGPGTRYAVAAARLLECVGVALVDDGRGSPRATAAGAPPIITLFAGFPLAWRGQPVEVHDAPTRFGLLSCAVRWHGERPALLWDLRRWPNPPPGPAVTLAAPSLDPGWSTIEAQGEALLAAPAPPDLEASFS